MYELKLIRGLPGSGKTQLAHFLHYSYNFSAFVSCEIFAADDLFYDDDGNYKFVGSRLGNAHVVCQENVLTAMMDKVNVIIVHNTFTQNYEMDPYKVMAEDEGYAVNVIHMESDFGSVHDVPISKMKDMYRRWEPSRD